MKYNYVLLLIVSSFIIFNSCGKYNTQRIYIDKLTKMMNTKVNFPNELPLKFLGKDTSIINYLKKEINIIIYTMPMTCTSCNLASLRQWKKLMTEINKEFGDKVGFVYIFHSKKEEHITEALKEFDFNYPAFYDMNGEFIKMNKQITNYPVFHVFLLNKDSNIVFVGNPSNNTNLWLKYKIKIRELLSEK